MSANLLTFYSFIQELHKFKFIEPSQPSIRTFVIVSNTTNRRSTLYTYIKVWLMI